MMEIVVGKVNHKNDNNWNGDKGGKVNPDDPEGQLKWRRVIQTAMIKSSAALYFIFPQIIIFFDISFGHILTSHFGKILHFIALKHKPKFCHKRTATEVEISDSENIFKCMKSANKNWNQNTQINI